MADKRIDYIEFFAVDIVETKKFYHDLFGWEFTDYGPDYTCFTDGPISGGFARTDAEIHNGALIVINVSNIEEIEKAVTDAGGKIVKDIFSFPGGRRFHFSDPSGNILAVWSEK